MSKLATKKIQLQFVKALSMKSNKCLVVSRTSPFIRSGSGTVINQFLRFFSASEMIFLSEKDNQIKETNSRVHYINSSPINLKRGKRFFRWQRWLLLPLIVKKIIALVKEEKCNSIMCVFPDEFHLIAATLAAKKLKISIYPYFHNLYYENTQGFSAIIAKLVQKKLFAQAPWVYLISDGLLKELSPLYSKIDFRILTHATIIDEIRINHDKLAKQKIQITFLGNINNSNIDAMSFMLNTLEQRTDVVINLITPTSIHVLKKARLLKNNTIINNNCSNEELKQKLRISNLLLLPHGFTGALSDAEYRSIFPTKTIQYLLSGSPILALLPHNCYLQDFLSKYQCAFCITNKNEQEIFSVLNHVKKNSNEIERITNNARKTVQIFSENKVLGKLKNQIFI
jgi:glycosyltransferase involved in cell wall biosynthesis